MDLQKLPEDVCSLLRSGVAITSPAQCVAELVTNSLDAGATSIAVRVDFRTFKFQVIDNGIGISKTNLDQIADRYMTSKCHSLSELQGKLDKFGFRGEALASLREMSALLTVSSRLKGSTESYSKVFVYGKGTSASLTTEKRPCHGTTITIMDFLINMPVRRKKIKEGLDFEDIKSQLECLAIIHPHVAFSLKNDATGKILLQTRKSATTVEAFRNLFGSKHANSLAQLKYSEGNIEIHGYISKEVHTQKSLQFMYINKRPVVKTKLHKLMNMILAKSFLLKANGPWMDLPIPKDMSEKFGMPMSKKSKFAVFIINISCPYSEYDITLDPRKTMVQFKNWSEVLKCLEDGVKQFLEAENLTVPSVSPVDASKSDSDSDSSMVELMDMESAKEVGGAKRKYFPSPHIGITRAVLGLPAKRHKGLEVDEPEAPVAAPAPRGEKSKPSNREKSPTPSESSTVHEEPLPQILRDIDSKTSSKLNEKQRTNKKSHNKTTKQKLDAKKQQGVLPDYFSKLKIFNLSSTSIKKSFVHQSTSLIPQSVEKKKDKNKKSSVFDIKAKECVNTSMKDFVDQSCQTSDTPFVTTHTPEQSTQVQTGEAYTADVSQGCQISGEESDDVICLSLPEAASPSQVEEVYIVSQEEVVENQLPKSTVRFLPQPTVKLDTYLPPCDVNQFGQMINTDHQQPVSHSNAYNQSHSSQSHKSTHSNKSHQCHNKSEPQYESDHRSGASSSIYHHSEMYQTKVPVVDVSSSSQSSTDSLSEKSYRKLEARLTEPLEEISREINAVRHGMLQSPAISPAPTPRKLIHEVEVDAYSNRSKLSSFSYTKKPQYKPSFRREERKERSKSPFSKLNEYVNAMESLSKGIKQSEESYLHTHHDASGPLIKGPASNQCLDDSPTTQLIADRLQLAQANKVVEHTHSDHFLMNRLSYTESTTHHLPQKSPFIDVQVRYQDPKLPVCDEPPGEDAFLSAVEVLQQLPSSSNSPAITPSILPANDSQESNQEISYKEYANLVPLCSSTPSVTPVSSSPEIVVLSAHNSGSKQLVPYSSSSGSEDMNYGPVNTPWNSIHHSQAPVNSNLLFNTSTNLSAPLLSLDLENVPPIGSSASPDSQNFLSGGSLIVPTVSESRNQSIGTISLPNATVEELPHDTSKDVIVCEETTADANIDWQEKTDPSGRIYYLNVKNGVTTYDNPMLVTQQLFSMNLRRGFMPKGSSPVLQIPSGNPGPDSQVLSVEQQAQLQQIVMENQNQEQQLATVKWTKLADDSEASTLDVGGLIEQLIQSSLPHPNSTSGNTLSLKKMYHIHNTYKFTPNMLGSAKVLGQWDNKFILTVVNMPNESLPHLLVLFDQHAVHERVRLERITREYQVDHTSGKFKSEEICPPLMLSLSAREVCVMLSFREQFECLGLNFEALSDTRVRVTHVPVCLKLRDERQRGPRGRCLEEMVTNLLCEHVHFLLQTRGLGTSVPKTLQSVLNSEACTGAVKFGDPLSSQDCTLLLSCLAQCDIPYQCAHGRPVLAPVVDLAHIDHSIRNESKPNLSVIMRKLNR